MPRFRRFEVKRETRDGGKIRPDDNNYKQNGGNSSLEQQQETEREANQVGGFEEDIDFDFEQDNLENEEEAGTEMAEENIEFEPPTKEETDSLLAGYRNLSVQGELAVNSYIASQAKKLGADKEELKSYLRQQEKAHIHSPEKVLHYHRTSMESAKKILDSGYLLNRANIRLNGGDISHLSGSSSANVQFTVDRYDEHGKLQMSGFNSDRESNVGAASTDIVFVMSPELLKEDSYDCFYNYPTVEKANIQECCATILAKNPEVLEQLQSILAERQIQIPTMLEEEFDRESILESLTNEKQEDEIPQITHSDVEQELSQFYTDDVTNDYLEAYLTEKISQIYGDRLCDAGIFNVRKFLDGKLDYFEGVESYKTIIEEIESALDVAESVHGEELQEFEKGETTIEEPIQEEVAEESLKQEEATSSLDNDGEELESAVARPEESSKSSFDQALINEGFNSNCVQGIKSTIKSVNPRKLVAMDSVLSKTKEQTLTRGGIEENGNEQDYR